MGLVDSIKAGGYVPKKSEEGLWKPLKGTYKTDVRVLRREKDVNSGAEYYQLELQPSETLEGDAHGKIPFRKRFYLDGDKAAKNVQDMNDVLYTAGIELDMSSDEAFEASFEKAIGQPVYIRAWGWTPDKDMQGNEIAEGERKSRQMWSVLQEKVAEKKRQAF